MEADQYSAGKKMAFFLHFMLSQMPAVDVHCMSMVEEKNKHSQP